ncbi:unnamed protein product [Alopecurus aequalis]
MDKSATETMIPVKAEPSPAAAVINVDLDPEALNCPRCHHPLVPPVFQCAAGHVVCSACYGNLEDKGKCVSCVVNTGYTRCLIPTSYTRCQSLDRVLGSARVACPHGCAAAKMHYHEVAAHAKTCLGGHETQGPAVRRMGPCGSAGGDVRDMDMSDVSRVTAIFINHWDAVDAINVFYEKKGKLACTGAWGGRGGQSCSFTLEPDEYLTSVEGHYSNFHGPVVVRSLMFVTNLGTYGPYGKEDGVHFALPAGAGGRIIGFHARTGHLLDAIGTYVVTE